MSAYSRAQGYGYMILHAQAITIKFYAQLGFTPIGDLLDEAGIPHLKMTYDASTPSRDAASR